MSYQLQLGMFYGTQVERPGVLVDAILYQLGNPESMTLYGYGGLIQDGKAVIVCFPEGHLGVLEEGKPQKRKWGKHPCFVVPLRHLTFRPECQPVGRILTHLLREWVVTDTEGDTHIVVGNCKADALAAEIPGCAIDHSVEPEVFDRRVNNRLWLVEFPTSRVYAWATGPEHLRRMLKRWLKAGAEEGNILAIPPDVLFPPEVAES